MFRLWKVAFFAHGFAPLLDAMDAGSGGGDGDPGDGGAGDPPADGAADDDAGENAGDDDRAARGSSDDDEDEDDDEDLRDDAEVTQERFKRVTAKLRKLSRRDRRFTPTRARLKELQDAGISLDDLMTSHRNFHALDAQIRRNPKLRALVHGDGTDEPAETGRRASRQASDEEFDESTLPFDPNASEANRYFANLARKNHEQEKTLRQLTERLNKAEGRDTQRTEREESREWKTVLDGALARIKQTSLKSTLSDAVVAAFQRRSQHGKSATQVVNHYITQLEKDGLLSAQEAKDAKAANKTGQPTSRAAMQQRIAENNRNLPRTVAPQGQPTAARQGKDRLLDVHKRLRTLSPIAR
jgi:hypothetical protein